MKSNLARKLDDHQGDVVEGWVTGTEARRFRVRTAEQGELVARRAVSCLVAPELGDRVLLAQLGGGDAFVLAVLEREEGASATLTHDGDLEVKLPEGRWSVVSRDGVGVTTSKDVSIVSAEVDVKTVDGRVAVERASLVARLAQVDLEQAKLFARRFDSILERCTERVKRSYRWVEELDQLKAHAVDWTSRTVMRLHGQNTVVTSEELVKMDGEQIHMG